MHIEIRDLSVPIKLGHFREERHEEQNVLVTVDVELPDELAAGAHDELERTIDYGDLVKCIDMAVARSEIKLVETVVEKIGAALLETFSTIRAIDVCVTKHKIPFEIARGARVSVRKKFSRRT